MATVVIVDDSTDIRLLIGTVLEVEPSFDVVGEAANGAEAVDLVRAAPPDLVVLDALLPDDDNFETLRAIKATSPATRVVVFSATRKDGLEEQARREGATAYVEKAGSIGGLLEALERALAIDIDDDSWQPDELAAVVAHGMLGSITVAAGAATTLAHSWDRLTIEARTALLDAMRSQARELRESLAVLPAVVSHRLLNELAALFMAAERLGGNGFDHAQRVALFEIVEGTIPRAIELLRLVMRGLPPEVIEELDRLQRSDH